MDKFDPPVALTSPSSSPVITSYGTHNNKPIPVSFNRQELTQILKVYGYKVSEGEWRDYAIDLLSDRAVFSVYRRTSEHPLYRIEKKPKLAKKQGVWSVITPTGLILKRGHELKNVLRVFEKKLKVVE